VRLWDVATGHQTAELTRRQGWVNTVAFAPDGHTLATGGSDGMVRLWDVATGHQTAELTGHQDEVNTVAFAPNGHTLATGDGGFLATGDGRVRLWDVATGRQTAELTGHQGEVNTVAFAPNGHTLATGGSDGMVRLWDVASGALIAALLGFADGSWAVLLPDGSYKLVGDPGDNLWWAIKLLRFAPGELDGFDPTVRGLNESAPLPR
jgi:WD40 repeat protein